MERYCGFCEIIGGREPADILHETEQLIVFRNALRWVPLMLLVVPKQHISQGELWQDLGEAARRASEMGQQHSPGGFRLLSNFGELGMQSQEHAHVHVIGGAYLGEYA